MRTIHWVFDLPWLDWLFLTLGECKDNAHLIETVI